MVEKHYAEVIMIWITWLLKGGATHHWVLPHARDNVTTPFLFSQKHPFQFAVMASQGSIVLNKVLFLWKKSPRSIKFVWGKFVTFSSLFFRQGEEPEGVVFQTVLFYSLSILLAPFAAFLASKFVCGGTAFWLVRLKIITLFQFYIVSGVLGLETQASNLCSAITAVVVLHVMLGLYIFRTFYPVKKQTKQD